MFDAEAIEQIRAAREAWEAGELRAFLRRDVDLRPLAALLDLHRTHVPAMAAVTS